MPMSRIPENVIEQIRDSNDIVDVISSYLPMKKKGGNYWANCPFHNEKTASFSVSPSKQIYHCFGCGKGGNVINFVKDFEKISFIESVKMLAERANIKLEMEAVDPQELSDTTRLREMHDKTVDLFHDMLKKPEGKDALEYLSHRGISMETIDHFKLGYAPDEWDWLVHRLSGTYQPDLLEKSGLFVTGKDGRLLDRFKGRLMFPIHDERGNAIGFGGRTMSDDKQMAKYLNSPETLIYNKRKVLYGLTHSAPFMRKEKKAVIVEGYMDFLQLYQNGFVYIAAGSGTAFTPEQAKLLRRYADDILLCYDSDNAGRQAAVKAGFRFSSQKLNCKVIIIPDGEDPDSFLLKNGSEAFRKLETEALSFMDFLRVYYKPTSMSVNQRADALNTISEYLREFPDPLYRELFARDIARLFHIEESTFLRQLNRGYRKPSKPSEQISNVDKAKHFKNQGESAEYMLIQLLLTDHYEIRRAGVKMLSPASFQNEFLKSSASELLKLYEKDIHVLSKNVPDRIQDDKIRSFIIRLLLEDFGDKNYRQLFIESLKQIELQYLKNEYNQLTEELQDADMATAKTILKKQMENLQDRKNLSIAFTEKIFEG